MATLKRLLKSAALRSGMMPLASALVPPGVVIVRYHSVQETLDSPTAKFLQGITHSAAAFEQHVRLMAAEFRPVTMDEVLRFLRGEGPLPKRAVAITLDDGFADNYAVAAPILERYGIRAAFYVTVGTVGSTEGPWFCRLRRAFQVTTKRQWLEPSSGRVWDLTRAGNRMEAMSSACPSCGVLVGEEQDAAVRSIERDLDALPLPHSKPLMMDWEMIKKLGQNGHTVGSHTMTHPNLAHVAPGKLRAELERSKRILEEQLGKPVVHFSYPSPVLEPHWTRQTTAAAADAGYHTSVTCRPGRTRKGHDPLSLPRVAVPEAIDDFRWTLEASTLGLKL
jgi:peptidoglycan/xylan/chitin deacetylase (PgdA/CDA1 family)